MRTPTDTPDSHSSPEPEGEALRIVSGGATSIERRGSEVLIRIPCSDVYFAMKIYDSLCAGARKGRVAFEIIGAELPFQAN